MSRFRPLPLPSRVLLFQHLAAMEKAGVPAERSYALLELGPQARTRVEAFRRLVSKGIEPPTAGANAGLFTLFETRLLRAAFAGGSPLPSYQRLSQSLARHARQMATLRAQLVMPVLTLALALFVQPLPRLFRGALSGAGYLWEVLAPLIVIGVLGVAAVRMHAWFASGADSPARPAIERTMLAIPLFGKIHLRRNVRDFCESLALLLGAGLSLFEALPHALATVDNHVVRADLGGILPDVQSGATLSRAIGALRVVDTRILFAVVHTGEESGTLPEMLTRHADGESDDLAMLQGELMTWLPRIIYGCVALWMAAQMLKPVFK